MKRPKYTWSYINGELVDVMERTEELTTCENCGEGFDQFQIKDEYERGICSDCLERMNEGETISEMRNNFYGGGRR